MPRPISMNLRLSHDAQSTDEVEVALIKISHASLDDPILLSTDPTERISSEPLVYGTYSTWNGEAGNPFYFVLVSAQLPNDQDDSAMLASLVFENVDNDIAAALRSVTDRATIDMAVVLASSPNVIEADYRGFKLISASGDAATVTLTISLEPITAEPWPAGRMTRQRFPGLHQ